LRQENERLTLIEREKAGEIIALKDQLRLMEDEANRYRTEANQLGVRLQSQ